MASVERIRVIPNKVQRQWRFPRPNGLAMGEPDKADSPVDCLPGKPAGHGGQTLVLQTMQDASGSRVGPGPASEAGTRSAAGIYSVSCKASAIPG